MARGDVLNTSYGEFMDLLACDAISKGQAKLKRPKKKMTIDELIALK
jgi:hypothetical protein